MKKKKVVLDDPPDYANGMLNVPIWISDDPSVANGMKNVPVYIAGGEATPAAHGNEKHTSTFITGAEVPANETDPNVDATLKGVALTTVQDHDPKSHGSDKHDSTVRLASMRWLPYYWTWLGYANVSQAGVANRVWLTPVWIPRAMTVSKMNCHVLTAGGANTNLRLGLYADMERTPVGGALLAQSANIDATSIGVKTFTFSSPISLSRGWVWAALENEDNVVTFNRLIGHYGFTNESNEQLVGCRYALAAFGNLTNPCPTVTTDSVSRFTGFMLIGSVDE